LEKCDNIDIGLLLQAISLAPDLTPLLICTLKFL